MHERFEEARLSLVSFRMGSVPFTPVVYPIRPSAHTQRWRSSLDSSSPALSDAASFEQGIIPRSYQRGMDLRLEPVRH